MSSRRALLSKLLETLVEEFGEEEVQFTLKRILSSPEHTVVRAPPGERRAPPKKRPSATELVERAEVQAEKRQPLLVVAEYFDRREFLPSVADVRQFIIMAGNRPAPMKDRAEAFRILLRSLMHLPRERLEQIADVAANAGPAQLGPISDAISTAGERISRPRWEEP